MAHSLGPQVRKSKIYVPSVPPCNKVAMEAVLEAMRARYIERGYWCSGKADNQTIAAACGVDAGEVRNCFFNLEFRGFGAATAFEFVLSVRERRALFFAHNLAAKWAASSTCGLSSEFDRIGVKLEEVQHVF